MGTHRVVNVPTPFLPLKSTDLGRWLVWGETVEAGGNHVSSLSLPLWTMLTLGLAQALRVMIVMALSQLCLICMLECPALWS